MLSGHILDFPKLVRIGEVTVGQTKEVGHYKLDWAKHEATRESNHEKWRAQCWPDRNIPFVPSLPDEYMDWCDNLEFAINRNYLREIRRTAQMAKSEWGVDRSFDTVIRERCLSPAIEFVWCSFYLLGDCIYDPETEYYSREGESETAMYVLPFRFWAHQTGRGLVKSHAKMGKLQDAVENKYGRESFQKAGAKWLEAAKDHVEVMHKAYEEMWENSGMIVSESDTAVEDDRDEIPLS